MVADRDRIRGGGGCRRGGGVLVVSICGGCVGGYDAVLDAVVLGGVAVVCRGEHHGCLVCFCVLVVEVDHASAAVRRRGNTATKIQAADIKGGKCGTENLMLSWTENGCKVGEHF